jgi:hypothetical protein
MKSDMGEAQIGIQSTEKMKSKDKKDEMKSEPTSIKNN